MRMRNHYKIGRLIWEKMSTNDMSLNKPLFILGNLAPDLLVSFVFRRHSYALCAPHFNWLLQLLYEDRVASNHIMTSFFSGVMAHYVCDFLCYPHTAAFKGSVREHYLYEKRQTINVGDILPFNKQKSINFNLSELMSALKGHIIEHERLLYQNSEISSTDIPLAIQVAMWAVSAIYLRTSKSDACNYVSESMEKMLVLDVAV